MRIERLSWPDNTCFVDRRNTCLHGWLDYKARDWLTGQFERVTFTPTSFGWSDEKLHMGGFYINCRTDDPGFAALLAWWTLHGGRRLVRGERPR